MSQLVGDGFLGVKKRKIRDHFLHACFGAVVRNGIAGVSGLQTLFVVDLVDESDRHRGHEA